MTITFLDIAEDEGSSDHMWNKVRRRKWWVLTTSLLEGQNAIEAATGLTFYDAHPDNNSTTRTYLSDFDCSCVEDLGGGKRKWLATATYKSQFPELRTAVNMSTGSTSGGGGGGGAQNQNPGLRNTEFESDSFLYDHFLTKDVISGETIQTTAGEAITGVKVQRARGHVYLSKFYFGLDQEYYAYIKSLIGWTFNDDDHFGFPAYTLKLVDFKMNPQTENGFPGHRITQVYEEKFDYLNGVQGWYYTEIPNSGHYSKGPHDQPAGQVQLIKVDGRPASTPFFLDPQGRHWPLGSSPTYRYYQTLYPFDYSTLPLNQ